MLDFTRAAGYQESVGHGASESETDRNCHSKISL